MEDQIGQYVAELIHDGDCLQMGLYAFPSRTTKGQSKIKTLLTPGARVTTLRNYVDWVVTEYGAVSLRGLSIRDRARALISIAHPEDRPRLVDEARELFYL